MKRVVFVLSLVLLVALLATACNNPQASTPVTSAPKTSAPATTAAPAATTAAAVVPATTAAPAKTTTPATSPAAATTPKYGGILTILYNRDHVSFGFPPMISGTAIYCGRPALEPLLNFDENWNFKPTYLVTDWKVATDGLTATMGLRKGVKFHDGTDFNADAVKWNLDQEIAKKVSGTETWKSIDVVDPYTVKMTMKQYDCTLQQQLSFSPQANISSPAAYQKNGETWALTHPVGTGPYMMTAFTQDVEAVYKRFDGYWGGKPYLDGVTYKFMVDSMVQMAALKSGAGDVAYTVTPQFGKELKDAGFNVLAPINSIIAMVPDSKNTTSPLNNPKVRQALEFAVDREAIAKMGYGYWRAAYSWSIPEYPMGYDPNAPKRMFNVATAKQLLVDAGYPNGKGLQLSFYTDQTHNLTDVLTVVQGFWKDVGVDVALKTLPRASYVQMRATGWTNGYLDMNNLVIPMYINVIPRIIPPDYNTAMCVSAAKPPGFAEAISQAVATTDTNLLKTRTQAVVKMMYDDTTVLPLYATADPIPMYNYVKDSGMGGTISAYLWTPEKVWLNK